MNTRSFPIRAAYACMVVLLVCTVGQPGVAADTPRSHLEPAGGVGGSPKIFASLGLKLTRASVVLRQQLALKRGAGVVVDDVAAGSRAARAGFDKHDVLVRLDAIGRSWPVDRVVRGGCSPATAVRPSGITT